jgi:hypothetical protein
MPSSHPTNLVTNQPLTFFAAKMRSVEVKSPLALRIEQALSGIHPSVISK